MNTELGKCRKLQPVTTYTSKHIGERAFCFMDNKLYVHDNKNVVVLDCLRPGVISNIDLGYNCYVAKMIASQDNTALYFMCTKPSGSEMEVYRLDIVTQHITALGIGCKGLPMSFVLGDDADMFVFFFNGVIARIDTVNGTSHILTVATNINMVYLPSQHVLVCVDGESVWATDVYTRHKKVIMDNYCKEPVRQFCIIDDKTIMMCTDYYTIRFDIVNIYGNIQVATHSYEDCNIPYRLIRNHQITPDKNYIIGSDRETMLMEVRSFCTSAEDFSINAPIASRWKLSSNGQFLARVGLDGTVDVSRFNFGYGPTLRSANGSMDQKDNVKLRLHGPEARLVYTYKTNPTVTAHLICPETAIKVAAPNRITLATTDSKTEETEETTITFSSADDAKEWIEALHAVRHSVSVGTGVEKNNEFIMNQYRLHIFQLVVKQNSEGRICGLRVSRDVIALIGLYTLA